ncbi:MAG: beta-ketoacyl-ACP synthase II [Bacilli bacterium]|nr:beta-ketoacyl-ACP synthase II [Bacilli bacterium]
MKRRVVITGMGVLSSIGNTKEEMWKNLVEGVCGIAPITHFDASSMKVKIAGEVKNLEPERYFDSTVTKRLDRSTLFALIASKQAYQEAHLPKTINHDRFGVYVSSGIGGLATIEEETQKMIERGSDRISPFFVPNSIINLIGGQIAIQFQAKGPNIPIVTACASGNNAIGEAMRAIQTNHIDYAFCGASEAPITALGVGGFAAMRALNTSNDPHQSSIPFDKRRSGFVMAEGSGILIIEEYNHAKQREAHILGELVGYGTNCDAYHITSPDPDAEGMTKCMTLALKDAKLKPHQIDYINAHGTSTPLNDRYETRAIKCVFKKDAYLIPISSTKASIGHSLAAAGAIEAIITTMALQNGVVPPTIHYEETDPECDLNYTANHPISKELKYAMSNSFGFGGQNAVIIIKKYEE